MNSAEWPIRQTKSRKNGGGTCSSRCFAAQKIGHAQKRERSRDGVATEDVCSQGTPCY